MHQIFSGNAICWCEVAPYHSGNTLIGDKPDRPYVSQLNVRGFSDLQCCACITFTVRTLFIGAKAAHAIFCLRTLKYGKPWHCHRMPDFSAVLSDSNGLSPVSWDFEKNAHGDLVWTKEHIGGIKRNRFVLAQLEVSKSCCVMFR